MPHSLYPQQVLAPLPQSTREWVQLRKCLFEHYEIRRKILSLEKKSLQLHFLIGWVKRDKLEQQELEHLFKLQQVAVSCRRQLCGTTFEDKILAKICQLRHVPTISTHPYFAGWLSRTDASLTAQAWLVLDEIDLIQFQENLSFLLSCRTRLPSALVKQGKRKIKNN